MLKQRTTASPADDGILPTKLYTHKARHASPHVHIPFPRVVSVHQRNQSTRNLKFTFISYLALCVCVCVCVCVSEPPCCALRLTWTERISCLLLACMESFRRALNPHCPPPCALNPHCPPPCALNPHCPPPCTQHGGKTSRRGTAGVCCRGAGRTRIEHVHRTRAVCSLRTGVRRRGQRPGSYRTAGRLLPSAPPPAPQTGRASPAGEHPSRSLLHA